MSSDIRVRTDIMSNLSGTIGCSIRITNVVRICQFVCYQVIIFDEFSIDEVRRGP